MAKKKIDPQDIAAATREHPYSLTQNVCTYNIVYDTALQSPFSPETDPLTFRRVGGQRQFVYADKNHAYHFVRRPPEGMDDMEFCCRPLEFQQQYQGYEIAAGIDGGSLKHLGGADSDLFQDKNGYYWQRGLLLQPADDLDEVREYLRLIKP